MSKFSLQQSKLLYQFLLHYENFKYHDVIIKNLTLLLFLLHNLSNLLIFNLLSSNNFKSFRN